MTSSFFPKPASTPSILRPVWITKYALTRGILRGLTEPNEDKATRIAVLGEEFANGYGYFTVGREVFWSEKEAIDEFERMRGAKTSSLEAQLQKVKNLQPKFEDLKPRRGYLDV